MGPKMKHFHRVWLCNVSQYPRILLMTTTIDSAHYAYEMCCLAYVVLVVNLHWYEAS